MFRSRHAPLATLLRAFIVLMLVASCLPAASAAARVTVLTIDGAIGPAVADYVVRGIGHAARDGSQLVVLQIDTPGGLDLSMRDVIKAILTSPVPVASFVAPSGARAASAGTYIMYASHIAAMAPGTNLGAATPVQIGPAGPQPEPDKPGPRKDSASSPAGAPAAASGPASAEAPAESAMTRKQVNDAAAYIRGLAQMRGRNAEWGEKAVREALSLSADEALKLHVVDYIAADVAALLAQLNGKSVRVQGRMLALHTAGAAIVNAQPDWRARLLAVITNPSIALILMSLGIYGMLFEFMNPGAVLPGVLGAICLLLALYGLQLLPVNYAGLALIFLGISFMVAEAFLPSFGVIGLGGIAAFIAGALILVDTELPGFGIPTALVVTVAVISALLVAGMASIAIRTRRRKVVSGPDSLVGSVAEVLDDTAREGWANAGGETWRVASNVPLRRGQRVRVLARRGPVLEVTPVEPRP